VAEPERGEAEERGRERRAERLRVDATAVLEERLRQGQGHVGVVSVAERPRILRQPSQALWRYPTHPLEGRTQGIPYSHSQQCATKLVA
jgi:hypothetical protein